MKTKICISPRLIWLYGISFILLLTAIFADYSISEAQFSPFSNDGPPLLCTNQLVNGQMETNLGWVLDTTSSAGAYTTSGYNDATGLALGPTDGSIPPVPTWSSIYQSVDFEAGSPLRLSFAYSIDSVALDPEHLLKLYVDVLGPEGEVVETFLDQEIKRNSRVTLTEGWSTFEATLNFTESFSGFLVFSAEYDGISDRGTLLIDDVSLCSVGRTYGSGFEQTDRESKSLLTQTHEGVILIELKTSRLEENQLDQLHKHNQHHLTKTHQAASYLVFQDSLADESSDGKVDAPPGLPSVEEVVIFEPEIQGITSNEENVLIQLDLIKAEVDAQAIEPLSAEESDVRSKVLGPPASDGSGTRLLLWLLPAMALFFFGAFMIMSIIVITKGWELFFPK